MSTMMKNIHFNSLRFPPSAPSSLFPKASKQWTVLRVFQKHTSINKHNLQFNFIFFKFQRQQKITKLGIALRWIW